MNERELQSAAIETAHVFGWRVAHFRAAKTKHGWRTPVEADGKGFPDLVLVRGEQLLIRELKGDGGSSTVDQREWLLAFAAAGVDTDVWRPRDWLDGRIERELRHVADPA